MGIADKDMDTRRPDSLRSGRQTLNCYGEKLVGARGFEPPTSCSQSGPGCQDYQGFGHPMTRACSKPISPAAGVCKLTTSGLTNHHETGFAAPQMRLDDYRQVCLWSFLSRASKVSTSTPSATACSLSCATRTSAIHFAISDSKATSSARSFSPPIAARCRNWSPSDRSVRPGEPSVAMIPRSTNGLDSTG